MLRNLNSWRFYEIRLKKHQKNYYGIWLLGIFYVKYIFLSSNWQMFPFHLKNQQKKTWSNKFPRKKIDFKSKKRGYGKCMRNDNRIAIESINKNPDWNLAWFYFFNGAHRSKWSNNDESAIIDQRSKRFAISNRSIGIFPLDSRLATFVAIGLCAKSVHPTLQLSHTMRTHADSLLSHICIYDRRFLVK